MLTSTSVARRGTSRRRIALGASVLLACAALLMGHLNTLPSLDHRIVSAVVPDTGGTHLGKAISARTHSHPGQSGIYALTSAREAFAARMHLANVAERSLDVQYYIWRN